MTNDTNGIDYDAELEELRRQISRSDNMVKNIEVDSAMTDDQKAEVYRSARMQKDKLMKEARKLLFQKDIAGNRKVFEMLRNQRLGRPLGIVSTEDLLRMVDLAKKIEADAEDMGDTFQNIREARKAITEYEDEIKTKRAEFEDFQTRTISKINEEKSTIKNSLTEVFETKPSWAVLNFPGECAELMGETLPSAVNNNTTQSASTPKEEAVSNLDAITEMSVYDALSDGTDKGNVEIARAMGLVGTKPEQNKIYNKLKELSKSGKIVKVGDKARRA